MVRGPGCDLPSDILHEMSVEDGVLTTGTHGAYYISIDFEATGLSRVSDQVTEVGVCIGYQEVYPNGRIELVGTFAEYVRPTRAVVSRGSSAVTGITTEMLADKDSAEIVLSRMSAFIDGRCRGDVPRILVAYNGLQFDVPLLISELARFTRPEKFMRSMRLDAIMDPLVWSKERLDKTLLVRRANGRCSYRLGDVYRSLTGQRLDGAHGALADSRAVLDILSHRAMQEISPPDIKSDAKHFRNPHAVTEEILRSMDQVRVPRKRVRTITEMFQGSAKTRRTNGGGGGGGAGTIQDTVEGDRSL